MLFSVNVRVVVFILVLMLELLCFYSVHVRVVVFIPVLMLELLCLSLC